ncbi:MAG: large conductance mechanosensitive channel protein MscL [Acidimicrobiales bacterium]
MGRSYGGQVLKDFKAFILRGNVVDLAIAVVIGSAFGTVVSSVVENLLTPLIAIPGEANFSDRMFTISGSDFKYGLVINALISFLLVAGAVFFFVIKPVNLLMAHRKTGPEVESTTKECNWCLSNVPVGAIVCAFCTREIDRRPA